jgi:hypothetical protein
VSPPAIAAVFHSQHSSLPALNKANSAASKEVLVTSVAADVPFRTSKARPLMRPTKGGLDAIPERGRSSFVPTIPTTALLQPKLNINSEEKSNLGKRKQLTSNIMLLPPVDLQLITARKGWRKKNDKYQHAESILGGPGVSSSRRLDPHWDDNSSLTVETKMKKEKEKKNLSDYEGRRPKDCDADAEYKEDKNSDQASSASSLRSSRSRYKHRKAKNKHTESEFGGPGISSLRRFDDPFYFNALVRMDDELQLQSGLSFELRAQEEHYYAASQTTPVKARFPAWH